MKKHIRRAEEYLLSLLLAAMIALSILQIALRQFFDSGLSWADPLLRHLVVWGGFLGAVLAVSMGKHISLDILSNFLSDRVNRFVAALTHLFSSLICAILTYASWLFLQDEMAFGGAAFLFIPSWGWNAIFLIAFAAMTLRYAAQSLTKAFDIIHPQPHEGLRQDEHP